MRGHGDKKKIYHRVTESLHHRVINESQRHAVVSSAAKELILVLEANLWVR